MLFGNRMAESEIKALKSDLRVVASTHAPGDNIGRCILTLIAVLSNHHLEDAELRQLWLEAHWLKSDYEQNVLSLPTNWELSIMQIARGHVSHSMRRYSKIVQAAADLGNAIKDKFKPQFCQ